MKWVDLRKGIDYLFRYRDVSLAANSRYLGALVEVDDPTRSTLWIASPPVSNNHGCAMTSSVFARSRTQERARRRFSGSS